MNASPVNQQSNGGGCLGPIVFGLVIVVALFGAFTKMPLSFQKTIEHLFEGCLTGVCPFIAIVSIFSMIFGSSKE